MLHALCRAPLLQQQLAVLLKQTVGVLPLLSQGVGGTLASPPRRRQIACFFLVGVQDKTTAWKELVIMAWLPVGLSRQTLYGDELAGVNWKLGLWWSPCGCTESCLLSVKV